MKTTKKLIGIGKNCFGIIIDKPILTHLNLKKGDLIEIEIKKAE